MVASARSPPGPDPDSGRDERTVDAAQRPVRAERGSEALLAEGLAAVVATSGGVLVPVFAAFPPVDRHGRRFAEQRVRHENLPLLERQTLTPSTGASSGLRGFGRIDGFVRAQSRQRGAFPRRGARQKRQKGAPHTRQRAAAGRNSWCRQLGRPGRGLRSGWRLIRSLLGVTFVTPEIGGAPGMLRDFAPERGKRGMMVP